MRIHAAPLPASSSVPVRMWGRLSRAAAVHDRAPSSYGQWTATCDVAAHAAKAAPALARSARGRLSPMCGFVRRASIAASVYPQLGIRGGNPPVLGMRAPAAPGRRPPPKPGAGGGQPENPTTSGGCGLVWRTRRPPEWHSRIALHYVLLCYAYIKLINDSHFMLFVFNVIRADMAGITLWGNVNAT